ncbi:MAG: metal-dependent hydrolase [Gemmatimonadaceae bacterium]|nr:metal-dependent hydrolase [Gemmatimonadaceae bacterium]
MASSVGHALVALSIAKNLQGPLRVGLGGWLAVALVGNLPDVDRLLPGALREFHPLFRHRGLTHSLIFACIAGLAMALVWTLVRREREEWMRVYAISCLAVGAHALIDMATEYGDGVAVLYPISDETMKFQWQPLGAVDLKRYPSRSLKVAMVLGNEVILVWLPAVLALAVAQWRRRQS